MEQTILVVDDEREIADLVEVYLKNEGFPVLKAYTAAEALEIIAQKELSLAILDATGHGWIYPLPKNSRVPFVSHSDAQRQGGRHGQNHGPHAGCR